MLKRIKFTVDSAVLNSRVHAVGDVVEVEDDHFARLTKVEKSAVETEEDPTVFPEPVWTAEEIPASPDGGQGGAAKAVAKAVAKPGNRR